MNDFIIPLNKIADVTSAKALSSIKHNVNKKVGHTGTLDKFASGLLIALTGRFTKLTEEYMNLKKTYVATIKFGKETDTLDTEGTVVATSNVIPTLNEIEQSLKNNFQGQIVQEPPKYSALHIDGKRASDLMRNGVEFEIKKRNINIYSNEIIAYNDGLLECRFTVSRGTYIRSIARDLALSLNTRGYLRALKRESVGPFTLSDAIDSNDSEKLKSEYSHCSSDMYVMTIGVFDGMHLGHQSILNHTSSLAKKNGLKSLAITFDKSPKNVSEFMTIEKKVDAIKSYGIDTVKVLKWDEELKNTSGARFMLDLMKEYNIKKIVTGADFSVGSFSSPLNADDLRLFFALRDIHIIDYVGASGIKKISSTYIHSLVKMGKIDEANKLLL